MLRTVRIILALFFFTSVTLLFLDYTGTLENALGWTAKIQLLPAILALNIAAVIGAAALTLLFGRLYCSTICPLGVFQDIISWLAGKRKKARFVYRAASRVLRCSVFVIFGLLLTFGAGTAAHGVASLIAPYSAFGRMASQILSPAVLWGNNHLDAVTAKAGEFIPGPVEQRPVSGALLAVALATFILLFVLAWRKGRLYCNTICPVGTLLGILSRWSLYKPRIDETRCVHCGLCAKNCKASCIDAENKKIDYSRCVVCGDCLGACRTKAIRFETSHAKNSESAAISDQAAEKTIASSVTGGSPSGVGESANRSSKNVAARRGFLASAFLILSAKGAAAQAPKEKEYTQRGDGGLAPLKDRKIPARETKVVPPGADGLRHFAAHCTACQLCVTSCPNHVLRPSTELSSWMKPTIGFENGWCRPECVECSQVCPSGAIRPISIAEKSAQQIGHAVWTKEHCVVLSDEIQCDNCARQCPTEAIQMVLLDEKNPDSKKIPVVDTEKCIGCGACEYHCPARPVSAFHVEGHERHRTI